MTGFSGAGSDIKLAISAGVSLESKYKASARATSKVRSRKSPSS